MSVNQVSGNNGDTPISGELKYDEAKYNELYELFTSLTNDDRYKAYFNQGAELDDLQKLLSEKLQALKEAIDNTYSEKKIDELMQALGALLVGNSSNMGLEARIAAYIALLGAKDSITEDDYQALLSKLNSEEGITQTVFNNLIDLAKLHKQGTITDADYRTLFDLIILGTTGDTLIALLDLAKARKKALDLLEAYRDVFGDKYSETRKTLSGLSLVENASDITNLINDIEFTVSGDKVERANEKIKQEALQNKGRQMTLAGLVLANKIRAENIHKELESILKEEQNLDDKAYMDENVKRLRDEGIWADKTLDRRQEIQQQEALQAAKNAARIEAERRSKNENI